MYDEKYYNIRNLEANYFREIGTFFLGISIPILYREWYRGKGKWSREEIARTHF